MLQLSLVVTVLSIIFSVIYNYLLDKKNKSDYKFYVKHAIMTFITVYIGQIIVGGNNKNTGYLKQSIKTGSPDF